MLAALLAAVVLAQAPAAEAGTRACVLALDPVAQAAVPRLESKLASRGVQVVARDAVLAPLRAMAMAGPQWRDAEAARARGLAAEQDLDLARARSELSKAGEAMAGLGAPMVDPEGYAALLAALARVQDEAGDPAGADETLRQWAALPVSPLDERSCPPSLVSRAVKARSLVAPRPAELPLPWVWRSNAVDAALVVQSSGPPGGETLVLLWYRRSEAAPSASSAAPLPQDPLARAASLERGVDALFPAPVVDVAHAKVPDVPQAPHEVVLGATFVFPAFEAYSRSFYSTTGIGLALEGRYVGEKGPAFGGRVELVWGGVDLEQATFTARWTVARKLWRFSFEPGAGVAVRQRPTMDGQARLTDVALVLEAGGYVGLRVGDVAELEEGLTLGLAPLASSYDINIPVALRTSVAFVF